MKTVSIQMQLDLDASVDNHNLGDELYIQFQEMYGLDMRTVDIEVEDE